MESGHDLDLSVIVACRDDEERAGHTIRRVAAHLRRLELRAEIFAVDEGSADNTLPLLALLQRELPGLQVIAGAAVGRAFVRGAAVARGRALLLLDARSEAPLAALGHALERLARDRDAIAVAGGYLVLHRVRTLRAHGALVHHRDAGALVRRFVRRARLLGLAVDLGGVRRPASAWERLRAALLPQSRGRESTPRLAVRL
jgi:glycosyltransferase involved in cell wall biosynthesis